MTWAIEGKPGGQGKFYPYITEKLNQAYKDNWIETEKSDTLFVKIYKKG